MPKTDLSSVGYVNLNTSKERLNKVYTVKLTESLIKYLRNNPESVAPSTYLRNLLIADMVQNGGVL